MTFTFSCSVPPSENRLKTAPAQNSRRHRHYPHPAYVAWLLFEAPRLALALRDAGLREPDSEHWWVVEGELYLKSARLDCTNLIKATLDLLSGAQVDRHMRIVRPGALWDDDRRACLGRWWVVSVESPTPRIDLKMYQREPPAGWKLPRKRKVA